MPAFTVEDVFAEIDRQAPQFGVNPATAKLFATVENTGTGSLKGRQSFDGSAVSPKNAKGVMQVLDPTVKALMVHGFLPATHVRDPNNLQSQVAEGLAAIKEMQSRMDNPADPFELAVMYNGGNEPHRNYRRSAYGALPAETQKYLRSLQVAAGELGVPLDKNNSRYLQDSGVPKMPGPELTPTRSAQASGSIRTTFSDPESTAAIQSIAGGMIAPGGSLDQTAAIVAESGAAKQDAFAATIAAITAKSMAEGEEAAASTALQTGLQVRKNNILNSMNLNPEAMDNLYQQGFQQYLEIDKQAATLREDIDRRRSVSIFDNPFAWLVNETRLPGLVANYNALVDKQNAVTQSLATADKIKNNAVVSAAQVADADLIGQAARAKARQDVEKANIELAKAQDGQASANAATAMQLAQIDHMKLGAAGTMYNLNKQSVTERAGESEKAKAANQELEDFAKVTRLEDFVGVQPGNKTTLEQFKRMPAAKRAIILEAATRGKLSSEFGEAMALQSTLGNLEDVARNGGAARANWLNAAAQTAKMKIKTSVANQRLAGKKVNEEEMWVSELNSMATQFKEETANLGSPAVTELNPYKLRYEVAIKLPELQNNPVTKFLQLNGPGGKEQIFSRVQEDLIIGKLSSMIANRELTAPQAADAVSQFYTVASRAQEKSLSYAQYGFPPLEKYKVIAGKTSMDLMDRNMMETVLTLRAAMHNSAQAFQDAQGQAATMFGVSP